MFLSMTSWLDFVGISNMLHGNITDMMQQMSRSNQFLKMIIVINKCFII